MIVDKSAILNLLGLIEAKEDLVVLYACEAGSRVWGFSSADSDYDVRFIYVRPTPWYLCINSHSKRDTITKEFEVNGTALDCHGWDLKKALHLFRKSNVSCLEWLYSPTVYRSAFGVVPRMKALGDRAFSPIAVFYHYYSMASKHYKRYIRGVEMVGIKKYLYTIRGFLAADYVAHERELPPVKFMDLVEATCSKWKIEAIRRLLARKKMVLDGAKIARTPTLDEIIIGRMNKLAEVCPCDPDDRVKVTELDTIFQDTLRSVWGSKL